MKSRNKIAYVKERDAVSTVTVIRDNVLVLRAPGVFQLSLLCFDEKDMIPGETREYELTITKPKKRKPVKNG
jgi:hypothetical protein